MSQHLDEENEPLEAVLEALLHKTSSDRCVLWRMQYREGDPTAPKSWMRESGDELVALVDVSSNKHSAFRGTTLGVKETMKFIERFRESEHQKTVSQIAHSDALAVSGSVPTLKALHELTSTQIGMIAAIGTVESPLGFIQMDRASYREWSDEDLEHARGAADVVRLLLDS